jgi:hypothetical protein
MGGHYVKVNTLINSDQTRIGNKLSLNKSNGIIKFRNKAIMRSSKCAEYH